MCHQFLRKLGAPNRRAAVLAADLLEVVLAADRIEAVDRQLRPVANNQGSA